MSESREKELLTHLHELFDLQGFITLEQLKEHQAALTVEEYQDWYQCLDSASLVKLVQNNFQNQELGWVHRNNKVLATKIVPTLLKRLEQQQTEIDSLNKSLIDTKRELRLAKKFANLEDSDPF